jgi:hypothetical protein
VTLKVIGSNPIIHPIQIIKFKFIKIFKKKLKSFYFLLNFFFLNFLNKANYYNNYFFLKNFKHIQLYNITFKKIPILLLHGSNLKLVYFLKKILKTLSIGSVLRLLNLKKKFLRRSLAGIKIFFNFLKSFGKFYSSSVLVFKNLNNFIFFLKKNFLNFCYNNGVVLYILYNISIPFTKIKQKKIKSIKRRLKKKIFINFIKNF